MMLYDSTSLFKWDDQTALRHHCGVCKKPLNNPTAIRTCFGPHSEPCRRFHQAMFRKDRSHSCAPCQGADEAHRKRHTEITGKLREVYTCCGRDWSLLRRIHLESATGRRGQDSHVFVADGHNGMGTRENGATKKSRKEFKKLEKAASRPKVITNKEIGYIESILHPESGESLGDKVAPSNTDVVEEIENLLRQSAKSYLSNCNQQEHKPALDGFGVDLNFGDEMARILGELKVSEFLADVRPGGLQGGRLKELEKAVASLKSMIVEDLVLFKKDELESRMRKAGYIRHTNRESVEAVEERHADRDRKAGEKILLQSTAHTGKGTSMTSIEPSLKNDNHADEDNENRPPGTSSEQRTQTGADRRHFNTPYKCLNEKQFTGTGAITPTSSNGLDRSSGSVKPTTSILRVIPKNEVSSRETPFCGGSNESSKHYQELKNDDMFSPIIGRSRTRRCPNEAHTNIARLPFENARASTSPRTIQTRHLSSSPEAERCVPSSRAEPDKPPASTTPESNKRVKKREREARRKARRAAEEEEKAQTRLVNQAGPARDLSTPEEATFRPDRPEGKNEGHGKPGGVHPPEVCGRRLNVAKSKRLAAQGETKSEPYTAPEQLGRRQVPVVRSERHGNWRKFVEAFAVDTLSDIDEWELLGHEHAPNCPCVEGTIKDCPLHKPCQCEVCEPVAVHLLKPNEAGFYCYCNSLLEDLEAEAEEELMDCNCKSCRFGPFHLDCVGHNSDRVTRYYCQWCAVEMEVQAWKAVEKTSG